MATTPNGTTYTIEEQSGAGGMMRWYVDDSLREDPNIPLLLFVHGNGGTYKSLDTTARGEIRDWLVDNGWAVFEADSGGSSNFGNDAAQASFIEGLSWVESRINVGTIAALGVSMGAVTAYWLASQSPFAHRVNHLVIQQGVSDLTYRYTATTSGTQVLGNAYGLGWTTEIDMAAWEIAADGHDPMWFDPATWYGTKVLQLWDDADHTVEWAHHGLKWVEQYGSRADVEVVGTQGFGHTFHAGLRQPAYDFLTSALTSTGSQTANPYVWTIHSFQLVGDDGRFYALDL